MERFNRRCLFVVVIVLDTISGQEIDRQKAHARTKHGCVLDERQSGQRDYAGKGVTGGFKHPLPRGILARVGKF